MSKEKILSLVTVSGMLLMSGGSLVQADVVTGGSDIIMVSEIDTGVTAPTTPPPSSTDSSTSAPNTDPSTPIPSTDPITDTTDPSTPAPSTDPSMPAPSTDPSTPAPSTDPSTPAPSTDSSTPTPSTPASKPITKPNIDNPISTVTGDVVVGTDNGKVIVKEGNGTVLKDAKEVGGEVQKDGTVAIKKSDGGLEVLPHTGESKTIFTIAGIILILGAIWISFKDNNKKFLTLFNKKKEK